MPGGHRAATDSVVPASGLDLRIAALPAPSELERDRRRGTAGAAALARPSRVRPPRPAAPASCDRTTLQRSRPADDERADPRRQRCPAGARPDRAGDAAPRSHCRRRDPELPGGARCASGCRGASALRADRARRLGSRTARGTGRAAAVARVPDPRLSEPERGPGRCRLTASRDARALLRRCDRGDRRDVRRAEPRWRGDAFADGEFRRTRARSRSARCRNPSGAGCASAGCEPIRRPCSASPRFARSPTWRARFSSSSLPSASSSLSMRSSRSEQVLLRERRSATDGGARSACAGVEVHAAARRPLPLGRAAFVDGDEPVRPRARTRRPFHARPAVRRGGIARPLPAPAVHAAARTSSAVRSRCSPPRQASPVARRAGVEPAYVV